MTLSKQPNELFSRHWFHIWNETRYPDGVHDRIDSLRKRLDELEIRLRKIRLRKFGASPNGGNKPISQSSALATAGWLRTYIGVWQINTEADLPLQKTKGEIRMIYPHNAQVMTAWNVEVMGEPNWDDSKKCCLIMLSDEAVKWLNEIAHWLEKNEGALV